MPDHALDLDLKKLKDLGHSAYDSFGNLGDYIWKTPNFIAAEKKIEIEKLYSYFPVQDDPEEEIKASRFRAMRWALEGEKLLFVFPDLMASSNLFIVVSEFEHQCLRLCRIIESETKFPISNINGSGIFRLLKYIDKFWKNTRTTSGWKQVNACIKVRNCLMHASGVLEFMRSDKIEIERIIRSMEFLPPRLRKRIEADEADYGLDFININETSDGRILKITNQYSWTACFDLRDYLVELTGYPKIPSR